MGQYAAGRTLVYVTTFLLVTQVGCHVLMTGGQWIEAFVLGTSIDMVPDEPGPAFFAAALLLTIGGLGQLVAFIATIVAFLMWFHRAAKNATVFEPDTLSFTPGAAVGAFFIPFVNLARPYQIARSIEAASGGTASPVLGAWWGAFIVSNIIGNVEARIEAVDAAAYVGAVSTIAISIAAFFCARAMFYIEGLQAERARSPHDIAAVFA